MPIEWESCETRPCEEHKLQPIQFDIFENEQSKTNLTSDCGCGCSMDLETGIFSLVASSAVCSESYFIWMFTVSRFFYKLPNWFDFTTVSLGTKLSPDTTGFQLPATQLSPGWQTHHTRWQLNIFAFNCIVGRRRLIGVPDFWNIEGRLIDNAAGVKHYENALISSFGLRSWLYSYHIIA